MRNFKECTIEERNQILQERKNNPFLPVSYFEKKYQYYNHVIANFFRENNYTTRQLTGIRYRKYDVNDYYFEKITTHEQAYLLGVFYADGYLAIEGGQTKRVGLDVKDVDWLEKIGKELGSTAPLYKTSKDSMKRLKITSTKMYEDLIKLGCFEHKTFKITFPNNHQVPFEFLNSFILGILDGDGSIIIGTPRKENWSPEFHINITGTQSLLQGIQKYLRVEHLKLDKRWPERDNNNYSLRITGTQQVVKILTLLYKDAPDFCLDRKKQKYEQIINDSRVKSEDLMLIPANPDDNGVCDENHANG